MQGLWALPGGSVALQLDHHVGRRERRTRLLTHPPTRPPRKSSDLQRLEASGQMQPLAGGRWTPPLLPTQPSCPWTHWMRAALPRRTGPTSGGRRARQTLEPARWCRTNHSTRGRGQHSPGKALSPRTRKWPCASPLTRRRARAAGNSPAWRKRAQEQPPAAAGGRRVAFYPATSPTFTFCP